VGDGGIATLDAQADEFRNGLVDGTGVRFLLSDTEFRQHLKNDVRGHLELSGQLINADFTHMKLQTPVAPSLTDLL